ncbi:MAG: HlyD family secretion protein [Sulfurimonas sp.]|nr:HlyD family secretion protein [Sulfurimonas sp.]MDQ7061385.1 HlyD family secretion protein [Sulfurimonas sp.]
MRYLFILVLLSASLLAKVYYAKVEAYEIRNISSNVSGLVLFIDENMIGKKLSNSSYIKIDSELDNKELKYISQKLVYLKNTVKTNKKVLKNLDALVQRKTINYDKIKSLKIKSVVEKDREFYDLVNSENQLLSTMKEIDNLNVQIADLNLRKAQLKRSIIDKNLKAKGYMLYSVLVRPGQVVGVATALAQVADVSRAKLTIYLDEVDVANVEKKEVYLDGKLSKYKVSRSLNIADTKNISKYRAQIIIDAPKVFSKLIKVELK